MSQELLLIAILITVNGFFAAVEMALVTSRRHRLRSLLKQGKKSAQEVLQVKEKPGHYLATVQVGITLVGTLASAFGGLTAGPLVADWLRRFPILAPYADQLALLLIVVTITYLSLVFGELVPKQLALRNPEGLSIALVRPVQMLAKVAALPIRFLSFSTDLIIGLLGPAAKNAPSTSSEEIELLVQQGTAEGIFQISEGAFVSGVFEFGDRKAHDVMTARTEMVALDAAHNPKEALAMAAKSNLSRFPIYQGDLDNIIGYLHLKDLVWAEQNVSLKDIARQTLFIPESAPLPNIYRQLTQQRVHLAIVLDEHGGTAGLLTLEDVLEVIVGEIDDEYHLSEAELRQLGEKTWLVAGNITLEQLSESIGANLRSTEDYSTCAGLILALLGHIPTVGETTSLNGISFTVRSMDKLRIDRVLVQKNG
ncbi:MAG TPA: hemolysin family protein [Anaerolineales bacterium]|nr:hemolysin family protein [Anaerolineales bacterium]